MYVIIINVSNFLIEFFPLEIERVPVHKPHVLDIYNLI